MASVASIVSEISRLTFRTSVEIDHARDAQPCAYCSVIARPNNLACSQLHTPRDHIRKPEVGREHPAASTMVRLWYALSRSVLEACNEKKQNNFWIRRHFSFVLKLFCC